MGAVGFNTGSGIIACSYTNSAAATLTELRGSISTNTPSIGNGCWGVLLSSTGVVIATTNTVNITMASLGTSQTYTFATPPNLTAGTAYYIGFAQPTGTAGYFPMGTYTTAYVPYLNYVTTTTVGGTPAPLTANLGYFGIEAVFAPTLAVSVNAATVVCGNTAVLSATTSGSYTWAAGPSNTNYSVVANTNSIYTVNVSTSYGCTNSATALVTVDPITVTATSNTTTICAGSPVIISASGAGTYTWNAGPSVNTASFTDTPTTTIVYSVQAGNGPGCSGSASVSVNVNPSPTVIAIASNNMTMCINQTNTLIASGGATYSWTTGSSSSSIIVTPTVAGTYSYVVTGFDAVSCQDTGVVTLNVSACTGVEEKNATNNSVNIYPNPFNSQFTIVFENETEGKTEIMITNILGEIVLREHVSGTSHSLNLSNLQSSIYFVTVLQNQKKVSCTKVLKQ
ncbi:MAG: psrP3 [Bacteroidetes bacterium]|nr:psrP3 [Bacteroidota bacterium]